MVTQALEPSTQANSEILTGFETTEAPSTNVDDARRNNGPESNVFNNTSNLGNREQICNLNLSLAIRDVSLLEPSLDKNAKEHNLKTSTFTTDDLPQSMKQYRHCDAITGTPIKYINGKLIAVGNSYMLINMDNIYDPSKSKEYNRAKMLAVYAHECYHLMQPQNPTLGKEAIVYPDKILEVQAYHQSILFLEKAAKAYSRTAPALAKAIQEVIQEEKREMATWLR